jgi:hypothetical protein
MHWGGTLKLTLGGSMGSIQIQSKTEVPFMIFAPGSRRIIQNVIGVSSPLAQGDPSGRDVRLGPAPRGLS